jgi:hypothetical protein
VRWLYWEGETKLLDEKRFEYFPHVFDGNVWIGASQQNRKAFDPPLVARQLTSIHIIERGVNMFPLYLKPHATLFNQENNRQPQPNLSDAAMAYLAVLGANEQDLFYHAVAVLHAPAYRVENAGALRQDWPRVPLPIDTDLLQASAALGREIAALLDTETPVAGVTAGSIHSHLRTIGTISRAGGGALNPDSGDLDVRANRGYLGQAGAVMPAKGRAKERTWTAEEHAALAISLSRSAPPPTMCT